MNQVTLQVSPEAKMEASESVRVEMEVGISVGFDIHTKEVEELLKLRFLSITDA